MSFVGVYFMSSAELALIGIIIFILAYRFYAKFIENKVFCIEDFNDQLTPAKAYQDGVDFVPTSKHVLIGHHFSSIAGAAPIVGPAVAVIWGWLPAVLWIFFGVIFMGACHDFGALILSMKDKGRSIANVAQDLLGTRARTLFLTVIFFLVWLVIAVFTLVIANLFIQFPSSVLPVNSEIILALLMGYFYNRKASTNLTLPSIVAFLILLGTIYLGSLYPISLRVWFGDHELMVWIFFLMIYSFIASVLPVWALLQPRDFINSHQLFTGLILMVLGLFIVNPPIVAPALNLNPAGAPPWFPFLFITIACGAISGFHGLVSGGTTSKQISQWKDARPVAYGSMLGEGLLALLATLAVSAGFSTHDEWAHHFRSWDAANGLTTKIGAFVLGASKFIAGVGIPEQVSQTIIVVLIISFAATSLDTACRIQRYIIGEVGQSLRIKALENRFLSSALAIFSAFLLMISADGGKGGLSLWPLFGATNQMLAGVTLLLVVVYLRKQNRNFWPYLVPAILVTIITLMGLFTNIKIFFENNKTILAIVALILFASQCFVIAEALWVWKKSLKAQDS